MKYSKKLTDEICQMISEGHTQKDAAILNGVTQTTFHEWMNTKSEFSESVKKAHAIYKSKLSAMIDKAAEAGTWQAAAWKLERRYKDDYSARQEVTGKDGAPIVPITSIDFGK